MSIYLENIKKITIESKKKFIDKFIENNSDSLLEDRLKKDIEKAAKKGVNIVTIKVDENLIHGYNEVSLSKPEQIDILMSIDTAEGRDLHGVQYRIVEEIDDYYINLMWNI